MLKALKRDRAFYGYLLRLTGPIALQNLITFSLGLIDTLMVSQLGNNEMAAVTAANVPVFLLISIVFGVQSGVGFLISQYWGKKDLPSISRAIGVAAGLGVALALVIALALFLWPVQIMDLMSNKHHLSLLGAPYLRVIGFSYVFNMLSSIYVSAQRSVENASFGMKLFGMSTVLNTGMNYLLIFGKCGFPMLGVEGAAIATVISRYVELAIVAGWTHSHKARNAFIVGAYRSMYIPGKLLRSITIKGMPLLVNEFLWSSGMAVLSQCYSTCGLDVVPAMNICSTLFNLGSVVYLSMGNSVGIIMGQMLGAGHSEEDVRDTNRKLIAVSIASGVVFGGLMAAVSEAFPGIYNTTDAVRHLAAQLIWISAVMMPFGSYLNATYFTLRSGGQTFVTFLFDSCFMWVFCVPLAFGLSRFTSLPILPLYAICQATDFIKCIIGTVMLKQGKWIQNLTV